MNNAMRNADFRAADGYSPVAGNGARNYLHEAIPGEDRLTVRCAPEKTQSAAAADAEQHDDADQPDDHGVLAAGGGTTVAEHTALLHEKE